jgi:beta-glucanase (GH16 family)
MVRNRLAILLLAILVNAGATLVPAEAATSVKPINAPVISYSANGFSFKATPAKWSDNGLSSFKWVLDGKAIAGAQSLSVKVSTSKKGSKLKFSETHELENGTTSTATSTELIVGKVYLANKIVIRVNPANDKLMEIASLPQSIPSASKPTYQWFLGYFEIKGATKESYNLKTSDIGADISVKVTFAMKGHLSAKQTSNVVTIAALERKYEQIWSEEFNGAAGAAADPAVWSPQNGDGVDFGNRGWGNNERQWYDDKISSTDGSGSYVIKATTAGAGANNCYYKGPCEWLSTKLVTKDKVGFKYGRIEARIKGPAGAGTWGAFWLLGANIDDRGWPGCGEIDVTELLGNLPTTNLGYIHGPLSGGGGRGDRVELDSPHASEYHTYAVDWLPDQIRYYLDGVPFVTIDKRDNDWVFDHEFYIIINLAMGGNLGGEIAAKLTDSSMAFDYIKVYSINGIGEVIKH